MTLIKKKTPVKIKNMIKSAINTLKNGINYLKRPIDLIVEKNREKNWLSKNELAEYRQHIKIYDVFNFFNELEILDIRLNILNDHVDYFVLVESTLTHSGLPKELLYEKNKHLFKKFEHKIIHYVIDTPLKDFEDARKRILDPHTTELEKDILNKAMQSDNIPLGDNNYLRDFYEKESVKKPLINLQDNDFCYISDLDEIWNPAALVDYSKDDIYKYKQEAYVYFLNNRSNEDWNGWVGTIATKYKNIKHACLNDLRTARKMKYTVINNGGWHFTFQGGIQKIKDKLASYSYHEINTEETRSQLETMYNENKDIKGRYIRFWKDESKLPTYLLENKEKYKELFK
jgi:beta-1,4-mannosyl-glycoprotein beta-1,4-N-acetylglucosaminyltransferase